MFTTSVSVLRFPDATPALSGGKVKERTALQAKRAPLLCLRLRASQAGSSITHMGLLPKYLFGKDFLLLMDCWIWAASSQFHVCSTWIRYRPIYSTTFSTNMAHRKFSCHYFAYQITQKILIHTLSLFRSMLVRCVHNLPLNGRLASS